MKKICFCIPQTRTDLNNNKPYLVGDLTIWAVVNFYSDGEFRSVDIDCISWSSGNNKETIDVTNYICCCQPEKWEEIQAACENNYKSITNEA